MAEGNTCTDSNFTVCVSECQPSTITLSESTLRLKLRKPVTKKRVAFTTDTVDNEHMNKKKSKCCCVFEKRHTFGESSSDTDDECEHCRGHVEVKKKPSTDKDSQCSKDDHGGCEIKN